jgi:hypothetical protein
MNGEGGTAQRHQELRELLGSYLLGGLGDEQVPAVQAHLDGCAACRAELEELRPLKDKLARVDPDRLSVTVTPPPELGARIRAGVSAERVLRDRRQRRERRLTTVGAAAAAVVLVAAGAVLGSAVFPRERVVTPNIPFEAVAVDEQVAEVAVTDAGVVPHTWGVEFRFVGSGFDDGETYRAMFTGQDGVTVPAGEFLGTGDAELKCNMQAALLREDVTSFAVVDADGDTVLTADL